MLLSWIIAAICGVLNLYLSISRGSGFNFALAILWMTAAFIWLNRWKNNRGNDAV